MDTWVGKYFPWGSENISWKDSTIEKSQLVTAITNWLERLIK